MDNIKWINGLYKEDTRIFDSEFEAHEWADSLYPDIVSDLGKVSVGYATNDKKVFDNLLFLLPDWAKYIGGKVSIHQEEQEVDGQIIYKIWAVPE